MKIAAYQLAVSADIEENCRKMEAAVREAAGRKTELAVFPECALTGYPPRNLTSAKDIDSTRVERCIEALSKTSKETGVAILFGTIFREKEQYYNRAVFLTPDGESMVYDKRALWGWDRDNFTPGTRDGIVSYRGFRIGIRICFEIRFPEYFRELFRAGTDANIVLFYDVADAPDAARYNLIKGHLQTRATENVTPIITANAAKPYPTAPTAVFGRSGEVLTELGIGILAGQCETGAVSCDGAERFGGNHEGSACFGKNHEGFVEVDLQKQELTFGERGRKELSDALTGLSGIDV